VRKKRMREKRMIAPWWDQTATAHDIAWSIELTETRNSFPLFRTYCHKPFSSANPLREKKPALPLCFSHMTCMHRNVAQAPSLVLVYATMTQARALVLRRDAYIATSILGHLQHKRAAVAASFGLVHQLHEGRSDNIVAGQFRKHDAAIRERLRRHLVMERH
jgi:hypothetical protein